MLHLEIRKEAGSPLVRQLYERLKTGILSGDLRAGEKLPSSRQMADALAVSRNTVMTAFDMLSAEGYISGVPGSGIFVARGAEYVIPPREMADYSVTAHSPKDLPDGTISFHSGTPALEFFPRAAWGRAAGRALREAPASALGYDCPQGRPELRSTLAAYLKKTRGIDCDPGDILVTTGAKQGLTLVAKCLLEPGDEAWIEDPSNRNVRKIFSCHTDRIVPIESDSYGIRPELFPRTGSPRLLFVTPSHQFPLGGVLPVQRRIEVVRRAREAGGYVIEDDYDSEFRYRGLPVSSLRELDPERVVYIGTFSKTLFPTLRLGYLVLPRALHGVFGEWKFLGDHHTNSLSQLTLMRFIESGELERHVARLRKIYRKRRDTLIAFLEASFPGAVKIRGESAGLHIVAEFSGVNFTPALIRDMEMSGVNATPVEDHAALKGPYAGSLILGYSHLSPGEIEEGVARLKRALEGAC